MMDFTFSLVSFEYYFLILVRISSFIAVAPFFGMQQTVPARTKVGLAACMSLLVFHMMPHSEVVYGTMIGYSVIVMREAIMGLMIGFAANCCSYIISCAGAFIDLELGLSMAQEYNPLTMVQESITGRLYNYGIMLLLLITDLYHYIARAIIDSYILVPVNGQVFQWEYLLNSMVRFCTDLLSIGFRINLPVFACALIMNCVLGIMAKVASQLNMFSVGIQIKILSGLVILWVTVALLPTVAGFISTEIRQMVVMMIKGMYGGG